jgi:transposase InsO family protein
VQVLAGWLDLPRGKFYDWQRRCGRDNTHNGWIPRDHWLFDWEREAIIAYHEQHPLEGYRCLTYMMLDANVVAVSPSSVYRVLRAAGLLDRRTWAPSCKGQGFAPPSGPHAHWHIDISYLNIAGTFYYLCSILDGYSRYVVHWEVRAAMKAIDVETILQRAREAFPGARPRIISDNGPQFVARDFKAFIRQAGMTHVRTSPYYPQSNGKIEAWNKIVKVSVIRPQAPETVDRARAVVSGFVDTYNHVRLHGAIGYITPADQLAGRGQQIWEERKQKLEAARKARRRPTDVDKTPVDSITQLTPVSCFG